MKEIEQIPFLTRQECELVRNKVLGLLPAWRKLKWPGSRGKAPFYILGYSIFSCRRNANRMREYRRGCSKLNPLLEQEFSWIYARLKKLLARTLGAPVHFRKDASLPGFQILLNHSAFVQLSGHWHVDLDSTLLKWKEPLDYSQIRAFTLPVTLPQCGGSVDYLNLHYRDVQDLGISRWAAKTKTVTEFTRRPHKLGQIIVQDGMRFHRIGALPRLGTNEDMRITLQGFVVRQKNHWEIYW